MAGVEGISQQKIEHKYEKDDFFTIAMKTTAISAILCSGAYFSKYMLADEGEMHNVLNVIQWGCGKTFGISSAFVVCKKIIDLFKK